MSRRARPIVLSVALLVSSGCSGGTKYIGSHGESAECAAPGAPPSELGLDPFYERYLDARGVPVVSSSNVSDTALESACDAAIHMLSKDADVLARLSDNGFKVAVIGVDEVLTDLPEFSDLYEQNPNVDWNYTVRSLGGSVERPVSSVGEENVLCLSEDMFVGESILVHSIAHGLRSLGIVDIDPEWDAELRAAYDESLAAGLWEDTFAATEPSQYWAEGVQSWYDTNIEATPPNGVHNEVNTRSELRAYDPELAALIAEYVPDDDWRPACPTPIPP
jgi:hypothetical protein